ncbi:MAG: valine--tRNA ligase [Deltaproteobacteria bacterium]|jgi:valyl-tRNA synthetase|nr:valine--tRNA ligase [Deltaproteobacteria bacterium]
MCQSTEIMDKNFNFAQAEGRIYAQWEKSGLFTPDPDSPGQPFVIVIPPPNVTGNLHMGHALDNTLQDILIRYHRMKGDNTLWVPGTDHAGIATQAVVERALAREGIKREDLGRQKFVERVWQWKKEYGGNIVRQLRRLGASCDWSRERFTLDEGLSKAVREVFVRLYEEDLIYLGDYIINWCPHCRTALADIEVEHQDQADSLYYIRYRAEGSRESLVVATTRPETMFGDTAVAVHPADERFKAYIGQQVTIPLTSKSIPVIGDEYVDLEFGTGALKVTPAHDPNDFQIGLRHSLPQVTCIDLEGILTEAAGRYHGRERFEARAAIISDLEKEELLVKVEPLTHAVGVCYRCRTVIEPLISKQWFVRTAPLAKVASEAVKEGKTSFIPAQWEKTYFDWMDNIRDWCISRQLWWGHRIPAWYCQSCGRTVVARVDPDKCPHCSGPLEQDPDVLDTWFSSGLWPFSTLGWPDETKDLARYYPTTVLVTGFDIIFFWVARMMMMSLKMMGQAPFRTVVLHPLVRDAQGQKMSKSKGNVIDPLGVIDLYGADAFRFTLASQAGQSRDLKLATSRVAGYGKFVNKIWNAARFTLANLSDEILSEPREPVSLPDRWIRTRLDETAAECRAYLEAFAFDRLAGTVYHFIWDEFCDWYLELIKPILFGPDPAAIMAVRQNLLTSLAVILKLLHPIMPFVTEEIWSKIPGRTGCLMTKAYPGGQKPREDSRALEQIGFLMDITRAVRSARADFRVPPSEKLTARIKTEDPDLLKVLAEYSPLLVRLMGVQEIAQAEPEAQKPREAAFSVLSWGEVWIPLAGHIDLKVEKARLTKEAEQLRKDIGQANGKLANPDYVAKAPPEVVEETRERLSDLEKRLSAVGRSLETLASMS